jgi:hypothetical protein
MTVSPQRIRVQEAVGPTNGPLGEYAMAPVTGSVTTLAAAAPMFSFRNASALAKIWLRYCAAQFVCTTGFTAGQEVGCALTVARAWSASDTAGTAIDMGGTNANANKKRVLAGTSVMSTGDCRVATAAAITAGTRTLDPNAIAMTSGFAPTTTTGIIIARNPGGNLPNGLLYDARDDYAPIVLGQNEGIVISNTVLMGAAGVGRWIFWLEWDEGTT